MTWTDAHNHLQDARLGNDRQRLIQEMKGAGIVRCVVNATHEADWAQVENLANDNEGFVVPAFGIHPWKAADVEDLWVERLHARLVRHPQAGVGECGLDAWVSKPALNVQIPVFLAQLRLAREMNRPVSIHCLKAWEALFQSFKQEPPPEKFLLHSFGGSIEVARRLIPLGAWFSFSGYFLNERKAKVVEVFRRLPRERILLESDAPDMLPPNARVTHPLPGSANHPANLPAIGAALAEKLGIAEEEMAAMSRNNAAEFLEF